ncbi:hypothetical protein HRbin10_00702 [bacterium HR10]|nr:hypothetical protein HRbin10_00702 [bacterium HR10]
MRALLRRQDGVEKANYSRAGVVELEASAQAPFEVRRILSVLKDELGFDPVKEIEITVVGRVTSTAKEWTITPRNGREVFVLAKNERFKKLKATEGVQNQEITLRGKLLERKGGAFVLAVESFDLASHRPSQ